MSRKTKINRQAGLDVSVFDQVIATGDADARLQLADELARFIADEATSAAERAAVGPALLTLAKDRDETVRRCLAGLLSGAAEIDSELVFAIIADDDEIALPFLSSTPALNAWRAAAVFRVGDEARQIAVARRGGLAGETIEEMVEACEAEVACALLDNRQAALTAGHCRTLYRRFGREPAIVERLLTRGDLPVDIRIVQARQASRRILRLVSDRGWLKPGDADELVGEAVELTVLDMLIEAEAPALADAVAFMSEKALLTPSLLLRAACLGKMSVIEHALAHLAGLGVKRASALMYGQGISGARSLMGRAGLPSSCHGVLLAAIAVERELREEQTDTGAEEFGRRLVEAMMIDFHALGEREQVRQLDHVARFAEPPVRALARRLKADLARAA